MDNNTTTESQGKVRIIQTPHAGHCCCEQCKPEAAAVGDDDLADDLAHDAEFHAAAPITPHWAARRAVAFLCPYLSTPSPAQGGGDVERVIAVCRKSLVQDISTWPDRDIEELWHEIIVAMHTTDAIKLPE